MKAVPYVRHTWLDISEHNHPMRSCNDAAYDLRKRLQVGAYLILEKLFQKTQ